MRKAEAGLEKSRLRAAEFDQLPETNQPTELIQGEFIVSPSPAPQHQRISSWKGRQI